jgi:hypothetical protein
VVVPGIYYPVNRIEESNCLVRILIRLKLLNHIANPLLAIIKLKGTNNTLICQLLVRYYIGR